MGAGAFSFLKRKGRRSERCARGAVGGGEKASENQGVTKGRRKILCRNGTASGDFLVCFEGFLPAQGAGGEGFSGVAL